MAPAPHCLHCGQVLDLADTNVATDVALCRTCGRTMAFSAILPPDEIATVGFAAPPRGVKVDHRVRLNRGTAEIFCGVGPFGRRQYTPLGRDTVIRFAPSRMPVNGRPRREIVMTTGSPTVKFGALLPENVRVFLAAVLRQAASAA